MMMMMIPETVGCAQYKGHQFWTYNVQRGMGDTIFFTDNDMLYSQVTVELSQPSLISLILGSGVALGSLWKAIDRPNL